MELGFVKRHPIIKDAISVVIFVVGVVLGTLFINTFIFRSFNVIGPSMEPTLYTGERLIVNRLPATIALIKGETYKPERGKIIVFKNPHYTDGIDDEFLVKRVIAFAGERISLKDGIYTVYNSENPNGFNPDDANNKEPGSYTSGNIESLTVPEGEIFVSGDHRAGNYSFDSRNGLGTIPLYDVVGPVSIRIFPFDKLRLF